MMKMEVLLAVLVLQHGIDKVLLSSNKEKRSCRYHCRIECGKSYHSALKDMFLILVGSTELFKLPADFAYRLFHQSYSGIYFQ